MPSTPKSKNTRSVSKNKKNLTSHRHRMMTKKLKLATRCPVNPRYKECNVNWFYCEKPSKQKDYIS